jgi:hypothetical protein
MGYYIDTTDSNMVIKKENFEEAYKSLVNLNEDPEFDDIKHGGTSQEEYEPGKVISMHDPRPEGYKYHPAKWFSWMEANWPESQNCSNLKGLLETVGFELGFDEDGNIVGMIYNDKTGCEHTFLEHIAKFIEPGSFMNFRGEDGEQWRLAFDNHTFAYFKPNVTWEPAV